MAANMKRAFSEQVLMFGSFLIKTGPIALVSLVSGSVLIATTFAGEHGDVVVAIGVGLAILGAIELSLSHRFSVHEEAEIRIQKQMLEIQRTTYEVRVEAIQRDVMAELGRAQMAYDGLAASYNQNTAVLQELRELIYTIVKEDGKKLEKFDKNPIFNPPGK